MGGEGDVVARVTVRDAARRPRQLERPGQLGGAQLEIVAPLRLRVEVERDRGRQVPLRRRVGPVEEVLGRDQAAAGGGARLLRAGLYPRRPERTEWPAGRGDASDCRIARAVEEPIRWIASNAGQEGAVVVAKVKSLGPEEGFNALNDKYENLVTAGVIDPTKVVRTALQNAASIASLMLTTEALVSQIPDSAGEGPAAGAGGMGGMY